MIKNSNIHIQIISKFRKLLNSSVLFSSLTQLSPTLQSHGLQHTRPPCPSPTPRVYSNSCLLSRWCHPTTSSSYRLYLVQLSQNMSPLYRWTNWRSEKVNVLPKVRLIIIRAEIWHQRFSTPQTDFQSIKYFHALQMNANKYRHYIIEIRTF